MIRFLAVAIAVALVSFLTESNAQAQGFAGGYQFGSGVYSANGCGAFGGFRGYTPREQPPYFAKFPPVYYSHIVKRPYGISPFAAPAGIAPVEMNYAAPTPITVKNPFFKKELSPAKAPVQPESKKNKSVTIINPFVENVVSK